MKRWMYTCLMVLGFVLLLMSDARAKWAESEVCVACHQKYTPGIVKDWQQSNHWENQIGCTECHGQEHTTLDDVSKAKAVTPETCAECHPKRVKEFKAGKHAKAWLAMNALPTIHWQAQVLIEGQKGCGGCHKIGLKTGEEMTKLRREGSGYGFASCDACHTRHLFGVEEARQPDSCRTCHMGLDHPQYEMYSSSKHGVRHHLKQVGALPVDAAAPTCQTCHMSKGNHEVGTAWGFLGVRLPLPTDDQWAKDRVTILQALGVLSPEGQPTARLDLVKAGDLARLDQDGFSRKRQEMLDICRQCHAANFAAEHIGKGDKMIQAADKVMAEAIRIVAGLYDDRTLDKPQNYLFSFPDLLTFHDAPTVIEQKLFMMFLKSRMRAFQGAFHMNPDYAYWYGWNDLNLELTEIKHLADRMRMERKLK